MADKKKVVVKEERVWAFPQQIVLYKKFGKNIEEVSLIQAIEVLEKGIYILHFSKENESEKQHENYIFDIFDGQSVEKKFAEIFLNEVSELVYGYYTEMEIEVVNREMYPLIEKIEEKFGEQIEVVV